MKRVVLAVMLVLVALTSGGGVLRRYPMYPAALFDLTDGFQTNATEVARFTGLSGSGTYATDRAALSSHATIARDSWPYTITAGAWESDAGVCEPVGGTQTGSEYEISYAATDIFAMALSGQIENDSTLKAATRTRLLELTGITDFEASDISGGNQCILDLGAAAPHIVEAAMLLEDGGYSGWTYNDRYQLANWLATEVFPLVSWGIDARKNNWGIVTFAGALTIAGYAKGGIASLTKHNGSVQSPATYFVNAPAALNKWLSTAAGNQLDSDCYTAGQVFGLQSHGGFPDELRRSVGTADCPETSLAFDVPRGNSTFYQQKTTNGLAHVCEILRRYTGSGASCFDLTTHGGNDEALYDAAQFSTGATFQSYYLDDNAQGFRYVAGEYYNDSALKAALDDGSVSVRGGRDYAYTKITHAPAIAFPVATCTDGVNCFCDDPTIAATPGLIECYDWEEVGWTGDGDYWYRGSFRGETGIFQTTFGPADGTCSWTNGQPVNPTYGDPCPVNETCAAAAEWRLDDPYQGNSKTCFDFIQAGQVDDEIQGLTLTGGHGTDPAIWSGNTILAERNRKGTTSGQGADFTTASIDSTFGITFAAAYSTNLLTAAGANDGDFPTAPWKHFQTRGAYTLQFPGGNTGGDANNPPFSGGSAIAVSEATCDAEVAAADLLIGNIDCQGAAFRHGAAGNGDGPTAENEFDRSDDWPLGEWACVRAYWGGMGTASGEIYIDFQGPNDASQRRIFHIQNLDMATIFGASNTVGRLFWDNYFNGTISETFYRYWDNVVIVENAEPVSCAAIGF